ncbi:MAG: hypothetical protein QME57_01265 [Patescibacteria group bacterium]|nr:hypothetical protein [Patescibacteria group bacterium]
MPTCQNCKQNFKIEPEDFEFYAKIKVPPPTWCPECRFKRRFNWRNERTFYKRKCNQCGKEFIGMYPKDDSLVVFCIKCWWSDKWNLLEYGIDYDFSQSFFVQFQKLLSRVPLLALHSFRAVNSFYCNFDDGYKDCYLSIAGLSNENAHYTTRATFCKDSVDLYIANKIELGYENLFCSNSYRIVFSSFCDNCNDSMFLYNCRNCSNCFGCTNLRNRQYCIFNVQYSSEDYHKKIQEFNLGSYANLLQIKQCFNEFAQKAIRRFSNITYSTNIIGDNVKNSKNCFYVFDIPENLEDSKFCNWGGYGGKEIYDGGPGVGGNVELIYETIDTVLSGSRMFFCITIHGSHNIQYSLNCRNSSNLFGCIGLRNKQYCILNKQYTKEEYEKLVPKIIDHMSKMPYIDKKGRVYKYGEFFPPELCPFCYNETIAQEYFPLTKEEALKQGYKWKDPEERNIKPDIKTEELPDHIKDVKDDILDKVIQCAHAKLKEIIL